MAENLDQFFDSFFPVDATFKTSAGATIRTVKVHFIGATGNIPSIEGQQFEAPRPFLQCKTADLASVDHSCKVVVDGVTYRVTNDLHDGSGISTVFLSK